MSWTIELWAPSGVMRRAGACVILACAVGCATEVDYATRADELASENGLSANGLSANGLSANGLSANGLSANGLSANGLSANGLSANGLSANGLSANGLSANGLSANGLSANGLSANGLSGSAFEAWFGQDPDTAAELMTYLARCALARGETREHVDARTGATYTWPGELGLAPQWSAGAPLAGVEAQLVTGCLAAHVNAFGENVVFSLLGLDSTGAPIPYTVDEVRVYSVREGAFFGDLTAGTIFVCNDGLSADALEDGSRICAVADGTGASPCPPLAHVGACQDVCALDATDTYYVDCVHAGTHYRPITTRIAHGRRPAERPARRARDHRRRGERAATGRIE